MGHCVGILAFLVLPLASAFDSSCNDIDSQACMLMNASRPDLCQDTTLAKTACARFCNLCPIECYHCNTTVADFHMCNTTKQCGEGEVCMRKKLTSFVDGHEEYELTCENRQTCDGMGLVIPFGKRDLESRDISISCCATDGCNYPPEMTTTTMAMSTTAPSSGCKKDVIVLVDGSTYLAHYDRPVDTFLSNLFSSLPIGTNGVLVSLATFSTVAVEKWQLDEHTSNASLQRALSQLILHGGAGDLNVALEYAVKNVNSRVNGNRLDASDVVIIISSDGLSNANIGRFLESQLHYKTDKIIAITVGWKLSSGDLQHLVQDSHHEFHIRTPLGLNNVLGPVQQLICPTMQ